MWRDLQRLCEKYGLPWKRPSAFPRSGLLAARIGCFVAGEPWFPEFVRAVFRANFAEDQDIAQAGVVGRLLAALGQDAPELLERAASPAVKKLLRERTAEASRLGIFGAPDFVVAGELRVAPRRSSTGLRVFFEARSRAGMWTHDTPCYPEIHRRGRAGAMQVLDLVRASVSARKLLKGAWRDTMDGLIHIRLASLTDAGK